MPSFVSKSQNLNVLLKTTLKKQNSPNQECFDQNALFLEENPKIVVIRSKNTSCLAFSHESL